MPNPTAALLLLLLVQIHFAVCADLRATGSFPLNGISGNKRTSGLDDDETARNVARTVATKSTEFAKACMEGILDEQPPLFCYKEGGDVGVVPTACPAGYHRHSFAECIEECEPGYHWDKAALCIKRCPRGYWEAPLTCTNRFLRTIGRRVYSPQRLTNFDSRVPCPDGMYKGGALCYRDCEAFDTGLVNCGIGACSATHTSCHLSIAEIALSAGVTALEVMETVVNPSPVKISTTVVGSAIKKIGKVGLRKAVKEAMKAAARRGKSFDYLAVLRGLGKFAKGKSVDATTAHAFKISCATIVKKLRNGEADKFNPLRDWQIEDLDFTGVTEATENCNGINSREDKIECASSVLDAAGNFIPFIGLAASLMKPVCKEQPDAVEYSDLELVQILDSMQQGQAPSEQDLNLDCSEEPIHECPRGYGYDHLTRLCSKHAYRSPRLFCREGFIIKALVDGTHACTRLGYGTTSYECPAGYMKVFNPEAPNGHTCTREILQDYYQACRLPSDKLVADADGHHYCESVELTTPSSACNFPYILSDLEDECLLQTGRASQLSCPNEYHLEPFLGKCKRVIAVRSPILVEAALICEPGFVYDPVSGDCKAYTWSPAFNGCVDGHRIVTRWGSADMVCVGDQSQPPIRQCEDGFTLVGSMCQRKQSMTAEDTCPDGFQPHPFRHLCMKKDWRDLEPYCLAEGQHVIGMLRNAHYCHEDETEEPSWSCSDGYEETSDGKCRGVFSVNPLYKCRDGLQLHGDGSLIRCRGVCNSL